MPKFYCLTGAAPAPYLPGGAGPGRQGQEGQEEEKGQEAGRRGGDDLRLDVEGRVLGRAPHLLPSRLCPSNSYSVQTGLSRGHCAEMRGHLGKTLRNEESSQMQLNN